MCGLSLDYKVFLFNVINELKEKGYSNRDAVTLALNRSGGVIEVAGLIMLIAFGGLIFSPVSSMEQTGLFLTVGILFDCCINTLLLTPTVMMILDEASYWPRD